MGQLVRLEKYIARLVPRGKANSRPEPGQRAQRQMQEAAREVVRRVQGDLGRHRP